MVGPTLDKAQTFSRFEFFLGETGERAPKNVAAATFSAANRTLAGRSLPGAMGDENTASADVIIHCDLNKTLLAKDEVKR